MQKRKSEKSKKMRLILLLYAESDEEWREQLRITATENKDRMNVL